MTANKSTSKPTICKWFNNIAHCTGNSLKFRFFNFWFLKFWLLKLWFLKSWPLKTEPLTIAAILLLLLLPSAGLQSAPVENPVPIFHFQVIATYPHSPTSFTQGLEYYNGLLYEGSGLYGSSAVSYRTLESATVLKTQRLDRGYFGEGITILNNRLYQLTWRSRRGFIYQADDLQSLHSFKLSTEGWGLCNNGESLIYSDGSHRLRFLDPKNLSIEKTIEVRLRGKPLKHLNELEWVEGQIYANVWKTDQVVMINPDNGHVTGIIQLQNLLPDSLKTATTDVLNGIAYDQAEKRLLVTGKNWPLLFHIELQALPSDFEGL